MSLVIRTMRWLWEAWWIWLILLISGVHYGLYVQFPQCLPWLNKIIALVCQLSGGLLILISINSNLGTIRRGSLLGSIVSFFKRFPVTSKPIVGSMSADVRIGVEARAEATVGRSPKTLEETLDYLQEQIGDLRNIHYRTVSELRKRIDQRVDEVSQQLSETQRKVSVLENSLDQVSVGGISMQIFGALLVVYGALAGYAT